MESERNNWNWTEEVEDLVHGGDVDKAISVLETVISKLEQETGNGKGSSSPELATALLDLSKLYSTKGFSLKSDQTRSRAFGISPEYQAQEFPSKGDLNVAKESSSDRVSKVSASHHESSTYDQVSENDHHQDSWDMQNGASSKEDCLDEDWEAMADCAPDELLSPHSLPQVSKLSLEHNQAQGSKRRGRGTFSYGKHGLYSDEQLDEPVIEDAEDKADCQSSVADTKSQNLNYGTRHVLVLADFPPSTNTTDLEKVLEKFKDRGVVIRWVNDTVALAVFRAPSIALEASASIEFPFTVRVLDESDELLSSIPQRDLEPPRLRPRTSARTAQRLIAQSMGIKLSSPNFGSRELRKQEEARKNRIVSRQNMRDDAWGNDTN